MSDPTDGPAAPSQTERPAKILCDCGHVYGLSFYSVLFVGASTDLSQAVAIVDSRLAMKCPKCGRVRRWRPSSGGARDIGKSS